VCVVITVAVVMPFRDFGLYYCVFISVDFPVILDGVIY
jgi:hypothetical protein